MKIVLGLVLLLVIALVPALIARRKGLGFWTYYAFGVIFWLAAVPVALLLKDKRQTEAKSNRPGEL
jgi:sterol desaturase/sphingolipid hydroxylase (fatty acid hydroxylase superfamily)